MPTPHSDKTMAEALDDYVKNVMTTQAIASKYGISASTLTVWAQNARLKLRSRGRRMQVVPNVRQRAMLVMAEFATYEQVGRKFGCEKQAVHRIVKRWKDWSKPKRPPFKPGEYIEWRGKRYRVLTVSQTHGSLMDDHQRSVHNFRWNQGGKLPKLSTKPASKNGG